MAKNPNGGKRPGAGRPKGGVDKKRKELQDLINDAVVKGCLDNLLKLANGIKLKKIGIVYLTAPDYSANAYLLDQKYGKARQRTDINLEGGIQIKIQDFTDDSIS